MGQADAAQQVLEAGVAAQRVVKLINLKPCPHGIADPTLGPAFCQFDDGMGEIVPLPDATGSRNEPIRQKALAILNASPAYRQLFGEIFPEVKAGAPIDFFMFGKAIAEFEFTLVFANAPIDQFASGNWTAMTGAQKRGALLFFGKAGCVRCHAVLGTLVCGIRERNVL